MRARTWAASSACARAPRARIYGLSGPSTVFDFTKPSLPSGVSFSRAGTSGIGNSGCTYIGTDGNFVLCAADVPRLNCAVGGGAISGLLIEGQGTNLALRSKWTDNTNISTPPTGWTIPFGTGTSASEASLYGSADGSSAIRQTASANRPFLNQVFSITSGVTYCMSFHLEQIQSGTPTYGDLLVPNVSTATIGAISYYRDGTLVSIGDAAATGRIFAVFACTGSGAISMRVGLGCQSNITANILISRPQVEAASWPSSYIPTAGAAVTRPADFAYILSSWLQASSVSGTFVVGYRRGEGSGKTCVALGVLSRTTDLLQIGKHGGGSTTHDATDGSTTISTSDGQAGLNKAAYTYGGVGFTTASFSVNGQAAGGDNLAAPAGLEKVRLGGLISSSELNAEVSYFASYAGRVTDAALAVLSA